MLFSAGVGIGLFFFGVAEPILHYAAKKGYKENRYYQRYYFQFFLLCFLVFPIKTSVKHLYIAQGPHQSLINVEFILRVH